jgi:NAD(P)-dependent dehydrogenase (short-subunit alcohol dehydrogenase family)
MSVSSNIPFDANEFSGKRALITGGTKGAGKAIAERFQRGGATVMVTARSIPEEKTNSHFIKTSQKPPALMQGDECGAIKAAVQAAGGASRHELWRVVKIALRAWPE